ncbi:MAG: hypothetical protein RL318_1048 [Fibrobacterota bacterium]|jgi:hypothetical protein
MKRLSLSVLSLGLLAAAPSHALFGVGVSYGMNSTSVSGENATLETAAMPEYLKSYATQNGLSAPSLELNRAKVSGLKQLGAKVWIDIPLTDITVDASSNVAWGSYASTAVFNDGTAAGANDLEVKTGLKTSFPVWGIGKGETPYINLLNDLTLRYTFLSLPPVISLVKLSAGGGVTMAYGTRVVGKDDVKDLFGTGTASTDPVAVQNELSKRLSDNLYTTTFGGHLDLNVTVKPPVMPLAIYVDGKWYLHTATTKAADSYPIALSAGVAFAL